MKKILYAFFAFVLIAGLSSCKKDKTINETINGFDIHWDKNYTDGDKKDALRDMISNMVYVEGGQFVMGDTLNMYSLPNEGPMHKVNVSSFYINKYEVTQYVWTCVMGTQSGDDASNNWHDKYGLGKKFPAYRVSYSDVEKFIEKLNSLTGLKFQLPTEAQWEFAATGGNLTTYSDYSGSDEPDEVAWTNSNATKCSEVGKLNPNELGLYDMSGNVWEMCRDWYSDYTEFEVTDPECTTYGDGYKVFRGGSWNNYESYSRVTSRYPQSIHYQDYQTGFRLSIVK
ncbi:MAG: formylglycine-generating enzyme family protein [Bacteroidales bacterium]|nr:formylglycine-generating enzyme family protein [Bacteroidales bacterium]